jgi:uncharacterized protein with HEPN domain
LYMKNSISDKIRLQHIPDSINDILIFTKDIDYNAYVADYKLRLAVVKLIENIGEASNGISSETIESLPDIEWSLLKGIRNVLIHEYFGIDYEMIWNSIKENIPELKVKIERSLLHFPDLNSNL